MFSIYVCIVVDGDGDGCCDLVGSIFDVLVFIVNYFKCVGWCSGELWGMEVCVFVGFNVSQVGCIQWCVLVDWCVQGVIVLDGSVLVLVNLLVDVCVVLLLLVGNKGLVLLVFCNYDVIYSYNVVESYVLVIVMLVDELWGGNGLVIVWLIDDLGLGCDECCQLQILLLVRGYDIGVVDGMIGIVMCCVIQVEQQCLGWVNVDGCVGQCIFCILQNMLCIVLVFMCFMFFSNYSVV